MAVAGALAVAGAMAGGPARAAAASDAVTRGGPASVALSGRSPASLTDLRADYPALRTARRVLLEEAERQLAAGDASAAIDTLERAAALLHAPDTEMARVRADLQAGQYRRALAFAAHAAGAHLEAPAAAGLYAWLLQLGGQPAVARRVLDDAQARAPDDPVLRAVRAAFKLSVPIATPPLLSPPHRMAPYAVSLAGQAMPPAAASVVSSGVLVNGGTQALLPAAALRPGGALWVRNGMGHTTEARVAAATPAESAAGLARLQLTQALPSVPGDRAVAQAPFAGSPGFAATYAAAPDQLDAAAAWPLLRQGFIGAWRGATGPRSLGIAVPDGVQGGPVLDAAGRLVGIALRGTDGSALLVGASAWLPADDAAAGAAGPASAAGTVAPRRPMPLDQAYERVLRLALQVIAAP